MSARGLVAKPTTRQVMVHIRVFLYQGYDIRFYCEHTRYLPTIGTLTERRRTILWCRVYYSTRVI